MKLRFLYCHLYIFFLLLGIMPPFPSISGYTHWLVTEHDMIEPIIASYYHLHQSWNLIKLIRQEQNWNFVQNMELKLNKVSNDLKTNQEYQNRVKKYYIDSNSACVKASKFLSEYNLYSTYILTLESKGISSIAYLNDKLIKENRWISVWNQPFCDTVFNPDFSFCCFEHLEAIRNRSLFHGLPEVSLYKIAVPQHLTPAQYGHLIASSLADSFNDTSRNWILYNMAAFYWRIKGSSKNAIECLRAALHTSPTQFQDVAMVSLANVLHLIKVASLDAIVLMKNAILISPQFSSHHMILGNIFASLGQFNNSLHHYEKAAKIHNAETDKIRLQDIHDRIFAARCSHELNGAISIQQRKLDQQIEQWESFQIETDRYREAKDFMDQERVNNSTQLISQLVYEAYVENESTRALFFVGSVESNSITDSESFLVQKKPSTWCTDHLSNYPYQDQSDLTDSEKEIYFFSNHTSAVHIITQRSATAKSKINPVDHSIRRSTENKKSSELTMKSFRNPRQFDMISSCNSLTIVCDKIDNQTIRNFNRYKSIHLLGTDSKFDIKQILTSKQGLFRNQEHPLPWYPPKCLNFINRSNIVPIELIDSLESLNENNLIQIISNYEENTTNRKNKKSKVKENANDDDNDKDNTKDKIINDYEGGKLKNKRLNTKLWSLVDSEKIRLEDIGQRIVTAITKQLAPQWLIFNIAGLYWRVAGNLLLALECEKLSAKLSPSQYRNVPFVNMAVILAELNKNFDAMKLSKAAMQIDNSNSETLIVVASLYSDQKKFHLAYHHLLMAFEQNLNQKLDENVNLNIIKCQICSEFQKHVRFNNHQNTKTTNSEWANNVTQIFINHKMCSSHSECSNIIGKNYRFLPHIKITLKGPTFSPFEIEKLTLIDLKSLPHESSNPQVIYGILWNTNLTDLHLQEDDCLVINDFSTSIGCHRNEEISEASKNAIKFLSELRAFHDNIFNHSISKTSTNDTASQHVCQYDNQKTCQHPYHYYPNDGIISQTLQLMTSSVEKSIINVAPSSVVVMPLNPEECEKVAPFDFKTYTPIYVSLNTMHINIIALLDSLTPGYSFQFGQLPICVPKGQGFLRKVFTNHEIDFDSNPLSKIPEYHLHTSFLKLFDDKYTLDEIRMRLYTGLQQNASDWRLATITGNFWRVSGDAEEAFKCLELALEISPEFHHKVILINAANILYRIHKLEAALEISHKALQYPESRNWIVIPFLVANIFASMEQWHKATLFYEACLSLKADFEEAIYRIKSIQCQQLVMQNLESN